MTHNRAKAVCHQCQTRTTRSTAGLCWQCHRAPTVRRDGDRIHIDGIGHITLAAALKLAHSIADEATP